MLLRIVKKCLLIIHLENKLIIIYILKNIKYNFIHLF